MTDAGATTVELVTDFTAGALAGLLAHGGGGEAPALVPLEHAAGPLQATLHAALAADAAPRTVTVVWADPVRSVAGVGAAAAFEDVDPAAVAAEVTALADLVVRLAARRRAVLFVRWGRGEDPGFGLIDLHHPQAPGRLIADADAALRTAFAATPNVLTLDPLPWLVGAGPTPWSPRQWFATKVPFGAGVLQAAADAVRRAVRTLDAGSRRIVLLDLDDTLWGGLVGEVGREGLVLGGHDPRGEAFVAFQQDLRRLTRIGVQLALVSRNDETVALDAFDDHPEMVLTRADLAGWRIGWGDKGAAVADLLDELRLGPASAVFLDDSPAERGRVREALPEVLVPEWPTTPLLYRSALRALGCFDPATLSREDRARTAAYAAERARTGDAAAAASIDDWLASLGLVVDVRPLEDVDLARAAQLVNKTNQVNLATRRMTEAELAALAAAPDTDVVTVRVADRYGEAGLTAVLAVRTEGDVAELTDLVMSCRVMGRGVERTLLHVACRLAAARGATTLAATFVPTARNAPCRAALEAADPERDGDRHRWDLSTPVAAPSHVTLAGSVVGPA
jgi:FkbH-like protein